MTSMFWGLRMEPGKRYSTTVGRSFHVSMASLDCSSSALDNEINSVMLEEGESMVPFILCNLQKQKILQCPLDLNFMTGDRVTFFCQGSGVIHLSGYIHDDPEDDEYNLLGGEEEEEEDEDESEEEEEEEEEEDDEVKDDSVKAKGKKKENGVTMKRKLLKALSKKAKLSKLDEGVEDSDEEDVDDPMKMDGISSDDEEVDEDAEGSDDNDGEEEEEETKPNKSLFDRMTELKRLSAKAQKENGVKSPAQSQKKDKKKKNETNKLPQKQNESIQSQKAAGLPSKKTVEGGVQIKDIKVGTGATCTSGKKASVYYIGRFKDNNKVFDSTRKGNGFTFTVGRGDVIKGWDVGVVGMKVGGKRTIVCPPNMAYGQKGSPPTIPGNSTLVFEVELKNVS